MRALAGRAVRVDNRVSAGLSADEATSAQTEAHRGRVPSVVIPIVTDSENAAVLAARVEGSATSQILGLLAVLCRQTAVV
ncbi:MAG: hypothetical protein ACI8Y4_000935 [Candidatus Poriferisodalaceae bacterium]